MLFFGNTSLYFCFLSLQKHKTHFIPNHWGYLLLIFILVKVMLGRVIASTFNIEGNETDQMNYVKVIKSIVEFEI